jgi:PPM family protein phosphatase
MAQPVRFALGNLSSVGRVRERNEDYFGYFEPPESDLPKKGRLFIVADGMGGETAGDVASRLAVKIVHESYFADVTTDPTQALRVSLQAANHAIYEHAQSQPDGVRMGTTCTALVVQDEAAHVAHVGDTRAYLIRGRAMTRLTRDHSLAESGHANILTRALGMNPDVDVDVLDRPLPISLEDMFLLCSDGLWGHVEDGELLRTVLASPDPQAACRDLVALANDKGGRDNITVQLVRIAGAADGREAATRPRPGLLAGLRRFLGAA